MKTKVMSGRLSNRIERERKTISAMISIYCTDHHGQNLCDHCTRMKEYAFKRLSHCPFQENKSTCGKCHIHCYNTEMRAEVRKIMKYSGPRVAFRHPLLALFHIIDGWREPVTKNTPRKQ